MMHGFKLSRIIIVFPLYLASFNLNIVINLILLSITATF